MSWTDPDDVIDSWIGDGAPADSALVQVWIDRAERMLRKRVPSLTARLDAEPPEEDLLETIIDVVSAMVQRVFRNPDGTRTSQSTTGPFSQMVTFGGDQPGYLWVTDDELDSLSITTTTAKAFQIDPLIGYTFPEPEDTWSETG
jgi:hypothetical protein